MNEVQYACSSCGFPVIQAGEFCPNCLSSFKSVGQLPAGTTGINLTMAGVLIIAGVVLAVGYIVGVSVGKK